MTLQQEVIRVKRLVGRTLKNRVTIVTGSIVSGWEKALRTIIEKIARSSHVDIVLEESFAPIAARALGDQLGRIRFHVLGFKRRGFEEKIMYIYSNTYPDILILLYRPGVTSNGVFIDGDCVRVPREAIGAERIARLAWNSGTFVVSIVRYCSNLGASLLSWKECSCPSRDEGFRINHTVYAPNINSINEFLEAKKNWFS